MRTQSARSATTTPPCAREALSSYVRTWEQLEGHEEPSEEDREVLELARSVLATLADRLR